MAAQRSIDEAIAEYRQAIRLKKDYAEAHNNLGSALKDSGRLDEAIAEYRQAILLKKDYLNAHYNLGVALDGKGKLDDAIAEFREAIRLKKDIAFAHNYSGFALGRKVQLGDVIARAHNGLGIALGRKGQLDDAIAEFREAIRLKKDYAKAHENFGYALMLKGRLDEAIAEYREVVRLKKDYPVAHYNLGNVLKEKGRLNEAIAEYQEAIRLKKALAEAHCNLGRAFLQQGRFADALAALKRGHELGSRRPGWPCPSAQWVREAERLVALEGKLPMFLKGEAKPADAGERIALAQMCQLHKGLYAAAARFYGEAFVSQPKLAENLGSAGGRYDAACAAALAGCGQGKDANQTDDKERARLRRQALAWLRADLTAWRRVMEQQPAKASPAVRQQMQHWLSDDDFAGVRGSDALAKLPEAERNEWRKLWQEVETLRRRAAA